MSTLQSYDYEDVHPKIEKKNTPESHLLIVQIPDGFARGDIGAKVEYDFGRVRVFGERSGGSNKMIRFNVKYQIPSHCDIGNIKGKIDGKIVTITMRNIPDRAVPQEEEEPTQENNNKAEEVNDQKDQQNTSDQDPKSNVESKEDAQKVTMPQKVQEENSQKDQVTKVDSKGETYHETSTSQEATQESTPQKVQQEISQKESLPQKGQEEISQKESLPQKGQEAISQKESLPQKGQEEISQKKSLPQKDQEEISQKESLAQKGQEEISQKSQVTKVESKENTHQETSTQSEGTHESNPQKGQDQGIQNKPTDTKDAKLQTEESVKDENKEKQMVVKEETKEHLKKAIESEKSHVVDDSSPTLERKTKDESKGSASVETFPPKKTYKEKGKEMINDKFGDHDEKKILESTRTRIKDMALSTTQAVTSYAKRFSEEDKQKLIYTGATILVVALGVYASYKYRSSRRA
ncbi:uncharacterized protein DDB_G0290301 [Medicago truncatula]|uniref:Transmembrane protein, putative n=1 Tax=Medicago truncatula TaxID=3880 RepID=G7IV97_MEDTR|nr:uncharacterized protein DDB_G0290301 [Medicago truncatula]AES68370.1 transmembrane protein, putative [Medicago truncatula]